MNTKELTLIVLDEKENFEAEYTQDRIGKELYKDVIRIDSRAEFDLEISKDENQPFILICHVFHAENENGNRHAGYAKLISSGIEDDYGVKAILVSSGDSGEVMKNIFDSEGDRREVYNYNTILREVRAGRVISYNKHELKSNREFKFDYGIITALYKDEFEEVEKHFDWVTNRIVGNKKYRIGHLKGNPEKKIVAAIPSATGMVDSAIIATQLLELFKPKFLLMSGVCGAVDGTNIGDIVVAKNIFTFQKGKVSDIKDGEGNPIELFDSNNNKVDYDKLFDANGKQIAISVEKFEVEHDAILDFQLLDFVEPELDKIKDEINKSQVLSVMKKKIDIHFEPMACSTMVINREGYFEDHIKTINRKTIAVEMESYGVARACQFGNEGKTKWIIFKSVMDNTKAKTDEAKTFAAHTSALFMKELLYRGILDS